MKTVPKAEWNSIHSIKILRTTFRIMHVYITSEALVMTVNFSESFSNSALKRFRPFSKSKQIAQVKVSHGYKGKSSRSCSEKRTMKMKLRIAHHKQREARGERYLCRLERGGKGCGELNPVPASAHLKGWKRSLQFTYCTDKNSGFFLFFFTYSLLNWLARSLSVLGPR